MDRFIPNNDSTNDNEGSKWSLTAFKKYLKDNLDQTIFNLD